MRKHGIVLVLVCTALVAGCATGELAQGHPEADKLFNTERDRPSAVRMETGKLAGTLDEVDGTLVQAQEKLNEIYTLDPNSETYPDQVVAVADSAFDTAQVGRGKVQAARESVAIVDEHQTEAEKSFHELGMAFEVKDDGIDHSHELQKNPNAASTKRSNVARETNARAQSDPTTSWWWSIMTIGLEVLGVGALGTAATRVVKRVRKGFKYDTAQEAIQEAQVVTQHVMGAIDTVAPDVNKVVRAKIKELTGVQDRQLIDKWLGEARTANADAQHNKTVKKALIPNAPVLAATTVAAKPENKKDPRQLNR